MRTWLICLVSVWMMTGGGLPVTGAEHRPRIILTTDGEIDDRSSFVRFLLYTTDFEVVGIVPANSKWQRNGHGSSWILKAIDRYEQVRSNLRKHHPAYPSAEYLQSRIFMGNENPQFLVGAPPFQDTPGSELIFRTLLDDDPRPVFVPAWGGANTQAQALWKLKQTVSPEEFQRAVKKIRIYCVPFQDSAGDWIVKNIPEATVVQAGSWYQTWNYHPQPTQPHKEFMSEAWLKTNVQTLHGPLGAWYPQENVSEGDTPSFLELVDNGLGAHESYSYGGWGGRFRIKKDNWWIDAPDDGRTPHALTRWTPATQNDFAARMDWCVANDFHKVNHNPLGVLNGDHSKRIVSVTGKPGETIELSAQGSTDPDGDEVRIRWFVYPEAGSYKGEVELSETASKVASLAGPRVEGPASIHVILQLQDDGSPTLFAYRRAIITVSP